MKLKNKNSKFVAKNVYFYDEIDSTQSEIYRRIADETIENGDLVIANIQTSGIGTHGRKWYTDSSGDIAMSMYIETNCEINKLDLITVRMAEIFQDIFKEKYNIKVDIKLPNDLMINSKKIGGILTESKVIGNIIKYLVIGIGINIDKKHFNEEIKDIATSIYKEYEIDVDREVIIIEFCERLEEEIRRRLK